MDKKNGKNRSEGAKKSWETRRKHYTDSEIHNKHSNGGKLSWKTRRKNYTTEQIREMQQRAGRAKLGRKEIEEQITQKNQMTKLKQSIKDYDEYVKKNYTEVHENFIKHNPSISIKTTGISTISANQNKENHDDELMNEIERLFNEEPELQQILSKELNENEKNILKKGINDFFNENPELLEESEDTKYGKYKEEYRLIIESFDIRNKQELESNTKKRRYDSENTLDSDYGYSSNSETHKKPKISNEIEYDGNSTLNKGVKL